MYMHVCENAFNSHTAILAIDNTIVKNTNRMSSAPTAIDNTIVKHRCLLPWRFTRLNYIT